jgi:hypothetical protein
MDAVNPLREIRNVVEKFDGSGIVTGEHALDQLVSAIMDRALPTFFDAIQLAVLGINPVVQSDKFVTDFLDQLQFLSTKLFH